MIGYIYKIGDHHHVTSVAALYAKHRMKMDANRAAGMQTVVHRDDRQVFARVCANSWLFQCVCGAGVATHPTTPVGCCFGCGAVYEHVVFPAEWQAIEAELLKREDPFLRHWLIGEPVSNLIQENAEVGL